MVPIIIDLLTDMAALLNIEFITFKKYYGMPRGALAQYLRPLLGKKRTSRYISRVKGEHYYIQTQYNDIFSHYNLFLAKLKDKLARKARVHMLSEYMGSCSCPPGHLIILLTSNKFNMAAVLVKRSNYLFLLQLDGRKD